MLRSQWKSTEVELVFDKKFKIAKGWCLNQIMILHPFFIPPSSLFRPLFLPPSLSSALSFFRPLSLPPSLSSALFSLLHPLLSLSPSFSVALRHPPFFFTLSCFSSSSLLTFNFITMTTYTHTTRTQYAHRRVPGHKAPGPGVEGCV